MELTDDLVAIQGILISLIKTTGEFTKINYKGGNEEKILEIIAEIQKLIFDKNYVKDGKINSVFDKQVEDIVVFLAFNTKYKNPLEMEEYDHLIDIMPQLSKCVFANIVYGLDLCKYYCKVIEKLPVNFGIELLEEIVPCLKKSVPDIQLRYAIMLLRVIADKLSSEELSQKDEDDIYKLSEVSTVILQFLTGIYPGHVKNLKAAQIYQHMGYTLLSLFELLLYCSKENINLKKFIENVLNTCCTLIKNVTINVFCSWAEIAVDDQPLQSIVSGKAYEVVEDYHKFKEAKELISMLGAIAKKPKSLSERIQSADISVIIKKVNVKDQDQIAWFKALLGGQILTNKEAIRCASTWAHLSDKNDTVRLLNLSRQSENDEAKRLAIKCASTLTLDDLLVVMSRYFYENKFNGVFSNVEKTETVLKSIFNKTSNETEIGDGFVKDMCLLMLESPRVVLKGVFGECLKNKCYTECYKGLLGVLREVVRVNSDFGVETLCKAVSDSVLDAHNVDNYVALLSNLLELDYISVSQAVNGLFLPLLERFRGEKAYEQLGCVLQIMLGCSIKIPATSQMTKIRWAVLHTMLDSRCTFLELDITRQQTANYTVDVLKNLCDVHPDYNFEEEPQASTVTEKSEDEFTNYYKAYLSCKTEETLLNSLYRDFSTENYAQCVSRVLQFLPRAVTSEWLSILRDIFSLCGSSKAMELLTDVMILLCKVVQTQDACTNTGRQVNLALKYCLQQYGMALQTMQLESEEAVEVDITRNIFRLVKHLPETVKEQEGLSIINIITQRSLKSLADDKEFSCLLISINNSMICRTVAQRMWK